MRSPSMANANITYDGMEIAKLTYSGRKSSALAAPFKGTRHPARSLPARYDAQAVLSAEKMYNAIWELSDAGSITLSVSGGRMTADGTYIGKAQGEASGTYEWEPIACMLDGCQHAKSLAVRIEDGGGPLVMLCTEEITFGASMSHA